MLSKPRLSQAETTRLFYVKAIKSDGCQCGRKKQRGRAFCYKCWLRLPLELRRPLYHKIGSGFETAYDAACSYLYG